MRPSLQNYDERRVLILIFEVSLGIKLTREIFSFLQFVCNTITLTLWVQDHPILRDKDLLDYERKVMKRKYVFLKMK